MTFRAYWAARTFLFEERFGPRIRAAENASREEEAKLAERYRRTVAAMRREEPDGTG